MVVVCKYESGIFYPKSKTAVQYKNEILQHFQIKDKNYYESCSDNEFNSEFLVHINDYTNLIPGKPIPDYLALKLIFGEFFRSDAFLSKLDIQSNSLGELQKILTEQLWSCARIRHAVSKNKCGMRQLENLQRGYRAMVGMIVGNVGNIKSILYR